MLRKILGGLLWVVAALILIGSIANGSFMSDRGSAAETYGAFIGTMLPIITNLFAGIFLVRFDEVYKMSYVEGFKTRKKQCSKIVLFLVIYAFFTFIVAARVGASGADNFVRTFIVAELPYFGPMMIFALMLSYYAIPYWNCNKKFHFNEDIVNAYLASGDSFKSYADDNSVLANDKVLFLPNIFCLFPLDQIASTKFTNIMIEQDVFFNLTNGKKIEIAAGKKKYDSIVAAIEANK